MKIKGPTDDTVFELKMNPMPKMPITIDNTNYYLLINVLSNHVERYDRYSQEAWDAAKGFSKFENMDDAELYGSNTAEGQAYADVARELRELVRLASGK